MTQKTVPEFRRWIRGRAVKRTIAWAGGPSALLFVVLAILVTIVAQKPKTWQDIGRNEVILTSLLIFMACIAVYLFYVGREPVIVYNEAENDRLKLQRRLSRVYKTEPNIQPPKFGHGTTPLRLIEQNQYGVTENRGPGKTIERFYIEFQNKKKTNAATEDADDIYVRLSFFDSNGKFYESDKPRWHGHYNPFDETTWYPKKSLKASGNVEKMYLVVREKSDSKMFVFGQESRNYDSFIVPHLELKEKIHYAHVELSAPNLDPIHYWIKIENKKQDSPVFSLLKSKPKGLKDA